MHDDDIWNLFAETGDIEYYLMYKSEIGNNVKSAEPDANPA